jgi:hypothetical protein
MAFQPSQKTISISLIGLALLVSIIWAWRSRSTGSSTAPVVLNGIQEPHKQNSDTILNVDSLTPQQNAIVDRINNGLPVEANPHRLVRTRVNSETIDEQVKKIGEIWGVAESTSFGVNPEPESTKFLVDSLVNNIRIKRIIETGLRDPEKVGAIIEDDLAARIDRWERTVDEYDALRKAGRGGFASSNRGEVVGDRGAQTFYEDRYAIPAEFFILANLGRQQALPLVSRFAASIELVRLPDKNGKFNDRFPTLFSRINMDVARWAAIVLLTENNEERYAVLKKYLAKASPHDVFCEEITVPASDALWNLNDIAVVSGRIDISKEPMMKLKVPKAESLENSETYDRHLVFLALGAADKKLPAICDPFR